MSLPNIHFQDTPIEFKEINPTDFDSKYYNVPEKKIIEPNDDGYIGEKLEPILVEDFENCNTTIINAGVGQGKSRTIIKMVNKYVSDGRFIVIIAVPYKNLIEQYVKDCEENIPENEIFNILELDEKYKEEKKRVSKNFIFGAVNDEDVIRESKKDYKVHILTVNSLLGNPGEEAPLPSQKRVNYFKNLQNYCEKSNKKIVIIFDEIHAAIHNFKEEFIYRLWNFQGLVFKNYIISATFNEASKEVIKYLSEFTKRNIFIIESERKRIPKKQSDLHLHFFSGSKVEKDEGLLLLVKQLLKDRDSFDMMVYSKNLIKTFLSKPVTDNQLKGKEINYYLYAIEEEINRCYSDIFDKSKANKKYDSTKINIGTNFTTGVNIEKENHTYIVILPKDAFIDYFNNKGVFSSGMSSVIQALARQRKKGDIHIFLAQPTGIHLDSLPYSEPQNEILFEAFEQYKSGYKDYVSYSNVNEQDKDLTKLYNESLYQVKKAKSIIAKYKREGLNRLYYPSREIYILDKGERILTQKYFGGDLASYILWASACNQFLNCNLKSISNIIKIYFSSSNLYVDIKKFYDKEVKFLDSLVEGENNSINLSKYELHEYFKEYLKTKIVYIDNKKSIDSQLNTVYLIFLGLILDAEEFKGLNKINFNHKKSLYHNYIKSSIYFSSIYKIEDFPENYISEYNIERIRLFKVLYELTQLIEVEKNEKFRVPNKPTKKFKKEFKEKEVFEILKKLRKEDEFLSQPFFSFENTFGKIKTELKGCESIYKLLIEAVFEGSYIRTTLKKKPWSGYKLKTLNWNNTCNLLYKPPPDETL
ncbi:DEAD/DEAH box helicase family protein [Kordia sp.]|uniref:DEAD/DEAH box helicase family protein n=1 Tax=Kordia sp. TaxID=1965332 RepID=UPI003B598C8D